MNMTEVRTDQQNKQRIDAIAPRFQRLHTDRIRVESNIERLTEEHEAAKAAAMEVFGTTDIQEIEEKLMAARRDATAEVDAFENLIIDIEGKLQQFSRERG